MLCMSMAVKERDQKLVVLIKRSTGESAEVASNSAPHRQPGLLIVRFVLPSKGIVESTAKTHHGAHRASKIYE